MKFRKNGNMMFNARVPKLHVEFELRRQSTASTAWEAWCVGRGSVKDMPAEFLLGHLGTFASVPAAKRVCEDWAKKLELAKTGGDASEFALKPPDARQEDLSRAKPRILFS